MRWLDVCSASSTKIALPRNRAIAWQPPRTKLMAITIPRIVDAFRGFEDGGGFII
jgi:hypothetical protein